MDRSRVARMANVVARRVVAQDDEEVRDAAMENVDQAIDGIIGGLIALDENLPKVKTDSVQEKAAIDTATDLLNEAVKPYMADVVKALKVFE